MGRSDLDGNEIKPMKVFLIGGGGFIGSHLCEKLMAETSHKVIVIDVFSDKIDHLLHKSCPSVDRIEFHKINIKNDSRLETLIKSTDITVNLAAICTPADYNTRPLDTIYSNFLDAIPVVKYCTESGKRLIRFSTCEIYGKTIGSFLPNDHPLRKDHMFYPLKEDVSPCIFGPVEKQRWSYACAKQMIERLIFAEGAEHGLKFTIVRPFNWIGPRMDFIPGIDGPNDGIPRVLACFSNENPSRANGQIFNVGNPNNEVTVKELAQLMIKVYAKVSGDDASNLTTMEVRSKDFYGVGYDDSDKRIPDMTIINQQLGWNPKTSLEDLLDITLEYQHRTYSQAIKKALSQPAC
ncbi:NAD-dependent epimerase/dehydratase [Dillenia turbinata]|uniref:NAD-dependent epimerase/dehydratase n=1 Tax=Dillenia turbinata TaxID=194707 RepID=A0AAN8VJH9_9MAGN